MSVRPKSAAVICALSLLASQAVAQGTIDPTRAIADPETVTLVASEGEMSGGMEMPAPAATVGDLEIRQPFARASLPSQPVGGGYLSITNTGAAADRLVEVRSEVAERVELHETVSQDGVMRMQSVEDGIEIPAGETVALEPGGYHVMFMGLAAPLEEGESASLTLVFETAGEVALDLPILARGAEGPSGGMDHGDMDHGEMDHGHMDH